MRILRSALLGIFALMEDVFGAAILSVMVSAAIDE